MNIAIFGMGLIGRVWSDNLAADGHTVTRWNRSPQAIPGFCADACEAVGRAENLIVIVSDIAAVDSVLDQIIPALTSRHLVIQSSTVSPEATKRFAQRVEQTGAAFLEAPFSGSKPAAEARKTVFFVGGEAAIVERARPVLTPLSSAIEHIGPIGSASALKLAMNVNISLVAGALCESLTFAREAGISDARFFSALKLNTSHSKLADVKQAKLESADYSAQFAVKHMAKDLRLAMQTVATSNLPQARALLDVYEKGLATGFGDDDFISLIRLAEGAKSAATQAAPSEPQMFITADWHLGETRLSLMNRPFENTQEQTETLIRNFNRVVRPNDIVIMNGDVISAAADVEEMRKLLPLIARFNGVKKLIRGNHDRKLSDADFAPYFALGILADGDGVTIESPAGPVYVTHYPTQSKADMFNCVGHIHSSWKVQLNMLNVGVDVHHYRPVAVEKLPFFVKAISEFYDQDVWVADHPANAPFKGTRGKPGRYLDVKGDVGGKPG
ncbi:MAG: NAD(P)-binding domain-containing protein [Planctomycetota bacterium]